MTCCPQSETIMNYSLPTPAGDAHEPGAQAQRDAALMKLSSCRLELCDDPCYINTQALQSTLGSARSQGTARPPESSWHHGSEYLLLIQDGSWVSSTTELSSLPVTKPEVPKQGSVALGPSGGGQCFRLLVAAAVPRERHWSPGSPHGSSYPPPPKCLVSGPLHVLL